MNNPWPYCAHDGTCSCAKFHNDPEGCERRAERGIKENSMEFDFDNIKALAEAAAPGEHIFTNPRDHNKWQANDAWHRAASPELFLQLLKDRQQSECGRAVIEFALELKETGEFNDVAYFLTLWNEGEFDEIRREFSDAPEAIYIGADQFHPATIK